MKMNKLLKKDTSDKILIKTCVRINKSNQLELFYYDERKTLVSFCYTEGHSECCLEYMYSCKLVKQDAAEAFISAYNMRFDDEVVHIYSKRLTKGF